MFGDHISRLFMKFQNCFDFIEIRLVRINLSFLDSEDNLLPTPKINPYFAVNLIKVCIVADEK